MLIVLEVNLANPFLAEPAYLFYRIEPGLGGIADVVIDQYIFRRHAIQDARIILSRNRVLESEDHIRLDCLRRELAKRFNRMIYLSRSLKRPFTEKRQQQHLRMQSLGKPYGIAHPAQREL